MKRLLFLSAAVALMLFTASSWAANPFCGLSHCIEPPCQECCKDNSDPCCHRMHLPSLGCEHTEKLIETLNCSPCCCDRLSAAKKLGNRFHADFCCNPEVVNVLVKALTCDTCWEVRRAAAWSLYYQDARVPQVVAALYIASKADRHYLVRTGANEALDLLILCRKNYYKDLFKASDVLIARIRPDYNPTKGNCVNLVMDYCSHCCETGPMGAPPLVTESGKGPEAIAPPKEDKKDEEKDKEKDKEAK